MARRRTMGRTTRRIIRRLTFISHRGGSAPVSEVALPVFTNKSGAGSPLGVVLPDFEEQFYRDTIGNALWQATGLTDNDWIQWI